MAHALETDPIGQLEENLQCNVCLEVLKDPRTLPCCHSFCKDCLEDVVQTCRNKARHGQPIREIPCPNCRATFPLHPDKHVADMPRNHFICNLVKVTAVLDRGIGVRCSHNCDQSYSVARCVTCEKFLCRECLIDHNKYRGNNGHSVLTMEELSKPENRKKIKDKMYCNEHSGKKLKVYCETCDQLICKDCMDFKHVKQGHPCSLVKDIANNYKELLASRNKKMEGALIEGNALVQRLSLTTKQLDRDAENIISQIMQKKDAVIKTVTRVLEQKTQTLLNKVDEIRKDKRANLDKQTEETNQFVESIKTSVQVSKKLVDQGTEEEIISSQKMMLGNADNLLTKCKEYFKASIPAAKLRCTASADKELIKEEILSANWLGEVTEINEKKVTKTEQVKPEKKSDEVNEFENKWKRSSKRKLKALPSKLLAAIPAKVDLVCATAGYKFSEKTGRNVEKCSICLDDITNKKTLDKCGHSFCADCINQIFKDTKKCPVCSTVYGTLIGNQPEGTMFDSLLSTCLPGFGSCDTITISYRFLNRIQGPNHPNPGKPYAATRRTAYLPGNKEGRKVLRLLRKAFDQKLTFTIGPSVTTGMDNSIIWNGIPHKTSMTGGPTWTFIWKFLSFYLEIIFHCISASVIPTRHT